MRIDARGGWITRAAAAGPKEFAPIIMEGLKETTDKILDIFNDMSAVDLPLMILAVRNAQQAIENCSAAKATNAVYTAE